MTALCRECKVECKPEWLNPNLPADHPGFGNCRICRQKYMKRRQEKFKEVRRWAQITTRTSIDGKEV